MIDEREARIDLAAAFRWAARLDMHEAIANHFSLALEPDGSWFLLNPWGLHFSEIRASDLLVVDAEGTVLQGDREADRTAACIHGPLHARVPHARCALHTHMRHATALASVEGGRLEFAHQSAARFHGQIAYDDDFTGLAMEPTEGDRIAAALGDRSIAFLAQHGVLVCGPTVAAAFDALYYLELACQNQVLAMSTGRPLRRMPEETARRTAAHWRECWDPVPHFTALKRILDREEPDYAE